NTRYLRMEVKHSPPDIESYLRLRKISGLRERTRAAAEIGLKNSLFAVTLLDEKGEVIGMGRVVGDGGCNFEVVDIAVDPNFQGQGLGRKIMEEIMEYLKEHVPEQSYVSLIANTPWLYEKFGFEYCAPKFHGMQIKW
ncbi:GNAT family N-acetyltransferase, partial [Aurantivibrio infirmus]